MDKMDVYNRLPIWGQNLACYVEGMRIKNTRYGKCFWKKLKEYEERDGWSYEQKCEYRDRKLHNMIHHAYNTVPYYRRLFDERGINPDSIRRLDDIKVLPVLTKEIVNNNPEDFLSVGFPKKYMISAHTSGTTGAGFMFKTTQEAICEQWAVWWRYRRRLGIGMNTLSGNFGTKFVVPSKQKKPPFWRYNKPCNQIYFSAFHEKPEYLKDYIQEIVDKKISWIHGYPSLLSELASEVIREGNKKLRNQIRFVTIGAENLLDYQAVNIERAFGVHVYQHYGLSEGVSNFSEYPDEVMYIDEDFAATEFVEENGVARIIGSNLVNYAMPLLRWDTKDVCEFTENQTGRKIISLDGRIEDCVVLPSGKKIGKLDHVFKDAVNLKEVQIKQLKNYDLIVYYVPRGVGFRVDIEHSRKLFNQTFGEQIHIEYERVDEIEKSKSGKLRFIVSEIN